jgi:protein SCO1/2
MIRKKLTVTFLSLLFLVVFIISSAIATEPYQRTIERYTIPDVELINQDGEKVALKALLETDQPVVLDFIYATCTTICPLLSVSYLNLQSRLTKEGRSVRLISITIDPDHDGPQEMKDYLKRYQAKPGWDFLTGTRADIDSVMKAFNAYIPDKMSHYPLNMIRNPKNGTWVRLFGLMGGQDFLKEYKKVADQ